jgi:hypothetical protein
LGLNLSKERNERKVKAFEGGRERKASLLHTLKGVVTLNLQVAIPQQFDAIFGLCGVEVLNPVWCLVGMWCNFFTLCWALRVKFWANMYY